MTRMMTRAFFVPVLATALAMPALMTPALVTPAQAQGLLDGLFGRQDRPRQELQRGPAQQDMSAEIEQLERRVRQLTGEIETLQFRNRQLEQQLQAAGIQPAPAQTGQPGMPTQQGAPGEFQQGQIGQPGGGQPRSGQFDNLPRVIPAPGGDTDRGRGRGDAFDPSRDPNAPGVPRALGSMPPGSNAAPPRAMEDPVGVPGGREPGAPLDLSALSGRSGQPPAGSGAMPGGGQPGMGVPGSGLPGSGLPDSSLPAPPNRQLSATGATATQPPSNSARDHYDLAYGYMLRKDFALAEEAFHSFLEAHPKDRRVGEAQYWLGESLFQRQRYDEAAERFLEVSTQHAANPRAPESLLRLGQSLAAMKQTEMACAALAEVERKYPRASGTVKQAADREQKRIRC